MRAVMVLVLLALAGNAGAQSPLTSPDFGIEHLRRFSPEEGVWYPPACFARYEPDWTCDYKAEVTKAFAERPDVARRVCAWRKAIKPREIDEERTRLTGELAAVCSTVETSEADLLVIAPYPTAIGDDIPLAVREFRERTDSDTAPWRFWESGYWFPRPCELSPYYLKCDYGAEVARAFRESPVVARQICAWRSMVRPDPWSESSYQMDKTLRSACAGVTPAEEDRAVASAWPVFPLLIPGGPSASIPYSSEDHRKGEEWLLGVIATSIENASTINPDERRRRAAELIASLSKANPSEQRFLGAIELMGLAPDHELTSQLLFRTRWDSISRRRFTVGIVEDAIEGAYRDRAAVGPDAEAWKRGLRMHLMMRGHFDEALPIAKELVATGRADMRSRDTIALAVLEGIAGDSTRWNALLADCPDPDPSFVAMHGTPATPNRYCIDVAQNLTSAIAEVLGYETPAAVTELRRSTLRAAPTSVAAAPAAPRPTASTPAPAPSVVARVADEIPEFIPRLLALADAADLMPKSRAVERFQLMVYEGMGGDPVEMLALRPESGLALDRLERRYFYESPTWHGDEMLAAINAQNARKIANARAALQRVYEDRAKRGPRADQWQEGLIAFRFHFANLETARDLMRARTLDPKDPEDSHPILVRAVLERIYGNPAPFAALFSGSCPPPHAGWLLSYGEPDSPTHYCKLSVAHLLDMIATRLGTRAPAAVGAMLIDLFEREEPAKWVTRLGRLRVLRKMNPAEAKRQMFRMLEPEGEKQIDARVAVYGDLYRMALQEGDALEVQRLQDQALEEMSIDWSIPFPEDGWERLRASEVATGETTVRENFQALIFEHALQRKDWDEARRIIELLTVDLLRRDFGHRVRALLTQLSLALINDGKTKEALRILGFLAHQPLDSYLARTIDEQLNLIASETNSPKPTLKEDLTPWDGPTRGRLITNPPKTT